MPREQGSADEPKEWLKRARSNLERARTRLPGVYLEDLCFDAQQAAEKAIKALLIHRDAAFPYVHDLAALVSLLEDSGEAVPQEVKEAARLTRFAVATRYPGVDDAVTEDEHQTAISIAETVVAFVEQRLGSSTGR